MSESLRPHGLYSPWNSPGQNTGAGSLSLLQGNFPAQGLLVSINFSATVLEFFNHRNFHTKSKLKGIQ